MNRLKTPFTVFVVKDNILIVMSHCDDINCSGFCLPRPLEHCSDGHPCPPSGAHLDGQLNFVLIIIIVINVIVLIIIVFVIIIMMII